MRGGALFRRAACISIVAVALIATSTGAAYAGGWDLLGGDSGQGAVTLRAWTRNYSAVAFVADHPGTTVRVVVSMECRNGDTFHRRMRDRDNPFRFVLRGLEDSRRCDHRFRVVANHAGSLLELRLYARP
jgi:hypothetical protein